MKSGRQKILRLTALIGAAAGLLLPAQVFAQSLCTEVKLEIKQEATLEREAFDAALEVGNQYPESGLTNFRVNVVIKDQNGSPADGKFFVKISSKENITAVDGTGTVQPVSTATVHWLIIPSTGAGGNNPLGLKYSVRADISYMLNGVIQNISTFEDYITVKPQPVLELAYVLPFEVFSDDPFTDTVEALEPFPLGVRITNVGYGPANNFKINSGQPQITENKQGLNIDFKLLGTYVGESKIPDTLLIPFGNITAGKVSQAAWIMSTSLSGRFVKFDASFTHADELGGQMTSLLQGVTTYTLLKDMLVDLQGRDAQFDFLVNTTTPRGAMEDILNGGGFVAPDLILESDQAQPIQVVTVPSSLSGGPGAGNARATLTLDGAYGGGIWVFTSLPAPELEKAKLAAVLRSDGKALNAKNVWISRHFNKSNTSYSYRLNLLDYEPPANASYTLNFEAGSLDAPPAAITTLNALTGTVGGQALLNWTATGEDGDLGGILGGRYLIQAADTAEAVFSPASAVVNIATNTMPGAAQNYVLSGLPGNATAYIRLWLQDTAGGLSEASNLASAYVQPYPPQKMVVGAVEAYSVTIASWSVGNNSLPIEYGIWIDSDTELPAVQTAPYQDSFTTGYRFDQLSPNVTWHFFGQARNPESGAVSQAVLLGSTVTQAALPGVITSTEIFYSSFTAQWSAAGNPADTEYSVELSTTSDWSSVLTSGWLTEPSYTAAGLEGGARYYLRVKARNASGIETAYTDLGSIKTRSEDVVPPLTAPAFSGPVFGAGPVFVTTFTELSLGTTDDMRLAGDGLGRVATTYYSVDSDTFAVYAGTFTLAEGEHVLKYFSVDAAENGEELRVSTVIVDNAGPLVMYEVAGSSLVIDGSLYISAGSTLTLSAADVLSGVKELAYSLDGTTGTAPSPVTLPVMPGTHTLVFYGSDNLGNFAEARTLVYYVDIEAPLSTAAVSGSPGLGGWFVSSAALTLASTDTLSGLADIFYRVEPATTSIRYAEPGWFGDGSHIVHYSAADRAGNLEAEGTIAFNVDTSSPVVLVVSTPAANAAGWNNSAVALKFTCSDTASGVAACPEDIVLSGEGVDLSTAVVVYDQAGNAATAAAAGLNLDFTSPESTGSLSGTVMDGSYLGQVEVVLASTDALSGVAAIYYSVDGSTLAPYTGALMLEKNGGHMVAFHAVDAAGNQGGEKSLQFVIRTPDTVAPVTTLSFAGPMFAGERTYITARTGLELTAADDVSGIAASYYAVDSDTFSVYAGSFTVSEEGGHLLKYYSVDTATNTEAGRAIELFVDETSPDTVFGVEGASQTIDGALYLTPGSSITLVAADALSGVKEILYSLDGATAAAVSPLVLPALPGAHVLAFRAADNVGNIGEERAVTFNVDTEAPLSTAAVSGTSGNNGWYVSPVELALTSTDALSGLAAIFYRVEPATESIRYTEQLSFGEGVHIVHYGAADKAGNVEGEGAVTFNVDMSSPVVAIASSPFANAAGWHNTDVTFSFACSDTLSGVAACPADIVLSGEGAGLSTSAIAYDLAGNASEVVAGGVNLDRTAPVSTASLSGTFAAGAYRGSAGIVLASTDALSGVAELTYSLDGGTQEVYAAALSVEQVGEHTLTFRARDAAGNQEELKTLQFTVDAPDTGAPETEITFDGPVFNSERTYITSNTGIRLAAADAISGIAASYYAVDNDDFGVYAGTFSVTSEGAHVLRYYSVDAASNTETAKSREVFVDNTAPVSTVSVSGSYADGKYIGAVELTLASTDALSGLGALYYSLNGGENMLYSEPLRVMQYGQHSLAFYAADKLGNAESIRTLSFTMVPPDSLPPVTALSFDGAAYGAAPAFISSNTGIVLRSTDDASAAGDGLGSVAAIYYAVDAGQFLLYGGSFTISNTYLPFNLRYYAVDAAGNSEAEKSAYLSLDNIQPYTSLHINGAMYTAGDVNVGSTVTFVTVDPAATGPSSGVSYTIYRLTQPPQPLNEILVSSGTYGAPLVLNAAGTYVLEYRSVDNVGNAEEQKSVTLTVVQAAPLDTAPPEVTLRVNGNAVMPGMPMTITSNDGISIEASDPMNPIGSGVKAVYYLIDVTMEACGPLLGTTPADPAGTCGNPGYMTPFMLSTGAHTVYYTAEDNAGNMAAARSVTFTVTEGGGGQQDTTPPDVFLRVNGNVVPPGTPMTITRNDGISLEANDPMNPMGSGVKAIYYLVDVTMEACGPTLGTVPTDPAGTCGNPAYMMPFMLSAGAHTVYYTAEDNAGNMAAVRSVSFTVTEGGGGQPDTTPPVVTMQVNGLPVAEGAVLNINRTDNIYIAASDSGSGVGSIKYLVDMAPQQCAVLGGDPAAPAGTCGNPDYTGFITLSTGTHTVYYTAIDNAGNMANVRSAVFNVGDNGGQQDTTPPETNLWVNGSLAQPGAQMAVMRNDVISITATDPMNPTGSGVGAVLYLVDITVEQCGPLLGMSQADPAGTCGNPNYSAPFTLPVGTHTVYYTAQDNAGNMAEVRSVTFSVADGVQQDTIAPVVYLQVNGVTVADGTVMSVRFFDNISLTAFDESYGPVEIKYLLDIAPQQCEALGNDPAAPAGTCGNPNYTGQLSLSTGTHVLYYTAVDTAHNMADIKSATLNVTDGSGGGGEQDNTPPVTSASVNGQNIPDGGTVTVSGQAQLVLVSTDSSGVGNIWYSFTLPFETTKYNYTGPVALPYNASAVYYAAQDSRGNMEAVRSLQVVVQQGSCRIAGVITAAGLPDGTNITVMASADYFRSGMLEFPVVVNGGQAAYDLALWPGQYVVGAMGGANGITDIGIFNNYALVTPVCDGGAAQADFAIMPDTEPPVAVITSVADGAVINHWAEISGTGTDNVGAMKLEAALQIRDLTTGLWWDPESAEWVDSDLATAYGEVYASANGAPNSVTWSIDERQNGSILGGVESHMVAGRRYTLYARAWDYVGNIQPVPAQVTVSWQQRDELPPVMVVTSSGVKGGGDWYRSAVTLQETTTDDMTGVASLFGAIYRDGVLVSSGSYPDAPVLTGDGRYSYTYYSADHAGNIEQPKTGEFGIDTVAPEAAASLFGETLENGVSTAAVEDDTVAFTAADGGSGLARILYTLDAPFTPETASVYAGPVALPGGLHTIYYAAEDVAGNLSAPRSFNAAVAYKVNIDPSTGPIGLPFTLTGIVPFGNFASGVTKVLIGGQAAPVSLWNDTKIQGTIPGALPPGVYRGLVLRGTTTLAGIAPFKVVLPAIDGLTPSSGAIGVPFTVTGSGFGNYSSAYTHVLLGGATVPLTLWTDTKIQGTIPGTLPAGEHDLVVERLINGGVARSNAAVFSLKDMEAWWLAPSSGPIGMPFTITGAGFGNYSTVYTHVLLGDTTAPVTLWTDGKIQGTVPGSLASGEYPVTVERRTADGGVMRTSGMTFEVVTVDVASMTPVAGPIGVPFTIFGANFGNYVTGYTRVLIGGTTCPVTLWSGGKIQGVIPGTLPAGDHPVVVERELNGGIIRSAELTFTIKTPAVYEMSPSSGAIGVPFTINGADFGNYSTAYTGVLLNGATVPITLWTDTKIQGTIPGNLQPGQYPITVSRRTSDGGVAVSAAFTFEVTGVTVASMTPVSGPVGLPFTIYGANFGNYSASYAKVLMGGTTCPVTLWTDTKIQGTVPNLAAGDHEVQVERSFNGGQVRSVPLVFSVTEPVAYSVTPVSGSIGVPFTITGTNFGNYSASYSRVLLGGTACPVTLWTDTKIQGTIPGALAAGDHELIVERTFNGRVVRSQALSFTLAAPYVDVISPATAAVQANYTLTGGNFGNYIVGYTRALINGTTGPVTLWTDNKIQGKLPYLPAGTYPVQVQRNVNGGLAESATVYITVVAPAVSSMTPTSGLAGVTFSIYGAAFGTYESGLTRVQVGTVTAAIAAWTDTKITGTIPTGLAAGSYDVNVVRGQALAGGLTFSVNGGYSPSARTTSPATVSAAFVLGEVYVYPNPAKGGADPVFHVECGLADSVKINVFTISGREAHEQVITGAPQLVDDGQGPEYAYEYAWRGHIPSGVYLYRIEAERAGAKLRKTGKFAVVR